MFDLTPEHSFGMVIHMPEHTFVSHPAPRFDHRLVSGPQRLPTRAASREGDAMTISITPARVLVLLTTFALVAVLLLVSSARAAGSEAPISVADPVTYAVGGGDTLWDIAAQYTADSGDVRATIFRIKQLNGLTDSVIQPGQLLLIPPR